MTATRAVNAPLPYQSSIPNPVMNLQEPGHPGGGRGGAVGKAVSAEEICPDEENGPRNQRNRSQNGVLLRFPCRGWEPLDQAKHHGKKPNPDSTFWGPREIRCRRRIGLAN